MNTKRFAQRVAHKTALLAATAPLAMILASTPALAQTPAGATAATEEGSEVEAIVVTGTLFKRTSQETASPVTVMTADSLEQAGITTISQAVRSVSADSAGSIAVGFQSGFSAGGAAVSLRGLGVSSTLVLIDGLRSTNFPINDDGHNAYVDLNSIPFSMVQRVEVLKDGASSTYGADAIGGVVNLIMRKRYEGVRGSLELGQTSRSDGNHGRGDLTLGFGDYDQNGFNIVLNAEYQIDGRITHHSRGFPYNNRDLTSIGGKDSNTADSSPTTNTPNAYVTRVAQTDLNNPFAGGTSVLTSGPTVYTMITPNCPNGTYLFQTFSASVSGTGCKHNLEDEYLEVQPYQQRDSLSGNLSLRLTDTIEAFATASYSKDVVSIHRIPQSIRANQPFGASPSQSSSNPGVVLPVWICSSGVNCSTAANRQLNPNNPYAAAYANDPANGAARIYYSFGDVTSGSIRKNEVFRGTFGLTGEFDGWDWRVDAVGAKDNLLLTDRGYFNIAALKQAINTGSYNFVDPSSNSAAVRNAVLPDVTTPSTSLMQSITGSATRSIWTLPGGDLQLAVGAQRRHEKLTNNNRNAKLETGNLTTASAFGERDVTAAFFELSAPVIDTLELNFGGRYDDYSEGFSHFSPKVGVKFTPIKQLALRGTWSEGFRAPTFAESGPRSQYAGFATFTAPAAWIAAHGGASNGYTSSYSLGQGLVGNPDLKPEISHAFTLGVVTQPLSWLSATVDYYQVKKDDLIVAGSRLGDAKTAYYANANATVAQACAAVAAVGPGYSCNTIDSVDPLFPNALPRIIIINAPFVNANSFETSGVDVSVTGKFKLPYDSLLTSKLEVTKTIKADLITDAGAVQRYAGTLGPYELSSGNGTPKLRGNWQNTLNWGDFRFSTTTYFVDRIKSVATDEGNLSTDCSANLYTNSTAAPDAATRFCYIKRFFTTDVNGEYQIKQGLVAYINVGNVFDKRAPVAPAAYASAPNYLITWHTPGVIGRTYKAGLRFEF